MKFELYKPPLVKKDSIPEDKRNNIYTRIQTKLLEIEYDKKSIKILFYFVFNFNI
jgi:hypothetical protein